jgi:hypothetical protein
MTSFAALERMAAQVLKPARSTAPVDLTTTGADVAPADLFANPGFVPDAVADAVEIGGMPMHEELAAMVFALSQRVKALEAMPHNQWRPEPCPA